MARARSVRSADSGLSATILLLLVLCGSPPAASGAPTVKLSARFDPNRLGVPTTIHFGITVSDSTGRVPAPITELDLSLPAEMGLASSTLGLAVCEPSRLLTRGPVACPANSRVGYGHALGLIQAEGEAIPEAAQVQAFLGPPISEDEQVLFHVEAEEPVSAELVFSGRLVPAQSRRFSGELDTPIPLIETWPAGPYISVTRFDSSLGPQGLVYYHHVDGSGVPFHPRGIAVPPTCPRGGFPFAANLSFLGGSQVHARAAVPCPAN
jgi:hypothetical protein